MAAIKTPPEAWIDAAFAALAEGGPDAVRVEALAASLGVSKGGFYWHFSNRGDLLERVLDTWEQVVVDTVISTVDAAQSEPRQKLEELFELALAFVSSGPGMKVELAVRDWARRDAAVAKRLKRVDDRRMDYMRSLFRPISVDDEDAEARCLMTFTLFVGNPLVTVEHPGSSRQRVVRRALEQLLA